MSSRAFALRLAPLLALALALRLLYGLVLVKTHPLLGDGLEFHNLALSLADGHGYAQSSFLTPHLAPTADKPPLYPALLAIFTLIGGHGWAPHQVAGALIGTTTVLLVGLLGRRIGGAVVGLVAAGLAAIYPMLIAADGSFRSESLYALLITATLLAAYALHDRPDKRRALACGVLIGLATLTRSEALVLVLLLVLPTALLVVDRRRALALSAIALAAAVVVIAPWLARCWIQFDRPVFVSTNSGGLLAGANCAETYHGEWLGQWRYDCLKPNHAPNEAEVSAQLASDGLHYARDHAGRLPVVAAVRFLRSWELFRPRQQLGSEHFFEGRDLHVEKIGVALYYLFALLSLPAVLALRRRGQPLRILAAPFVLVTLVSIGAYGFTRFRIAAEPVLVVLAAVTLVQLAERCHRTRRAGPPAPAQSG